MLLLLWLVSGRLWARMRASLDLIRKRDGRPPIIFLRSFQDDGNDGSPLLEKDLNAALRAYGPFVAIGRPGELRPAAAARQYFRADRWQEAVAALMDESGAIIVVPGLTPSLDWEIAQVVGRGHLHKTIFVLPPRGNLLARFQRLYAQLAETPEIREFPSLQGVKLSTVFHDHKQGWVLITSEEDSLGAQEAAIDVALYGMWVASRLPPQAKPFKNA